MRSRQSLSARLALTDGEWQLRRGGVFVWVPDDHGPAMLTVKDRLRGYSQWRRGVRDDFTRQAFSEYQRFYQRPVAEGEAS